MNSTLRLLTTGSSVLRPVCPPAPSTLCLSGSNWTGLRSLSTKAAAPFAALKKTRRRKKSTAALSPSSSAVSSASTSPSASSLVSSQAEKHRPTGAVFAANKEKTLHHDTIMMENDVRTAVRMLMLAHLSRTHYTKKEGNTQREKEREEYLERHEERERRLWIKDENSRRLLGNDGRSLGEGIMPIVPAATQNPYGETAATRGLQRTTAAARGGSGAWRALNPVGLAASQAVAGTGEDTLSEEDYSTFLASSAAAAVSSSSSAAARTGEQAEVEDWKSATLAMLCEPNLSVYDTDHDFRVSSEDVVRRSKATSATDQTGRLNKKTTAASETSALPFALGEDALEEELDADLSASTAAQLKQQFAEEEDPDYAVSLYTDGSDEDEGPLQL